MRTFQGFPQETEVITMTEQEILTERERCKRVIETKIKAVIEWRLKKKRKRFIFVLEKLSKDLLWLIDNPNYKRKPKT